MPRGIPPLGAVPEQRTVGPRRANGRTRRTAAPKCEGAVDEKEAGERTQPRRQNEISSEQQEAVRRNDIVDLGQARASRLPTPGEVFDGAPPGRVDSSCRSCICTGPASFSVDGTKAVLGAAANSRVPRQPGKQLRSFQFRNISAMYHT